MTLLALETRSKNAVDNCHDASPVLHGDAQVSAALRRQYPGAIHRPTPACYTYNCHGLTFASRRTQILLSADVRRILGDDDYVQIGTKDVLAGDIVIYIGEDGDIEHSGIVMDVPKGMLVVIPKVLSKWGSAHEVVHNVLDCPYKSARIEYYRVHK